MPRQFGLSRAARPRGCDISFVVTRCAQFSTYIGSAAIALLLLIPHPAFATPLEDILARTEFAQVPPEAIVAALLKAPDEAVGLQDDERKRILAVPGVVQEIRTTLLRQTKDLLLNDSPSNAIWLSRIARSFLASSDPALLSIENRLEIVESAEHLAATGEIKALRDLVYLTPEPDDRALVVSRFLRAVHKAAEAEIERGRPAVALEILGVVTNEFAVPKTKELFSSAIVHWQRELASSSYRTKLPSWPLDDPGVAAMLEAVSSTDPGVALAVTHILSWRVVAAVANEDLKLATDSYAAVLARRPDPNEINNDLRMEIAAIASREPMLSFARGRIEELKGLRALTATRKLALLYQGYYGMTLLILLVACILILVSIPLLARISPRWLLRKIPVPHIRLPSIQLPKWQREIKRGPGYLTPVDAKDEYSELLELFGLDDSATEDDIKAAYRAAIKLYHPDHIDQADPRREEIADRFRRMQHAYERIVSIRGAWFGGGH